MKNLTNTIIPNWVTFNPTDPNYKTQKYDALAYIRVELSEKHLKKETLKYVTTHCNINLKKAEKVEDWKYIPVGKYCWMLNNGAIFDKETNDFFILKLDDILKIIDSVIFEKTIKKNVVDISKILFEDLEDLIISSNISDNGSEAYQILVDVKPAHKTLILLNKYIRKHIIYLKEFNKDIVDEAYPNINNDLIKWSIIQRTVRTFNKNYRKKQKITNGDSNNKFLIKRESKIINDLQFQKEDTKLQMVSISPTLIINSHSLLMYNTHTRRITLLYSENEDGLTIRGTTIHDFDIKKSFTRISRNPSKQLISIKNATLLRAEIIMNDYLTGKRWEATGRTNNHTILIKVW